MLSLLAFVAISGCAKEPPPLVEIGVTQDSRRVLVVYNANSDSGKEIADYYVMRRHIPSNNVLRLNCGATEDIGQTDFLRDILAPIRLKVKNSAAQIDFIVLTKGVPIRMDVMGYAVDAWVAAMDLPITPIKELTDEGMAKSLNPYFSKDEPFSSKKFGFYLVTRLDGYTVSDCKDLVDHSLLAKPEKGPFLLDESNNRGSAGYIEMQDCLTAAAKSLKAKGFDATDENTEKFIAPSERLAGYASWGSNDGSFKLDTYKQLRFKPGALAETFVSTSGRTFNATTGGQSLIADLIANGVTGVKGYVSEPYTFALARTEILFDRYTGGRNLAESFYAASRFLKWKDVVIGDPLCSPYAKK